VDVLGQPVHAGGQAILRGRAATSRAGMPPGLLAQAIVRRNAPNPGRPDGRTIFIITRIRSSLSFTMASTKRGNRNEMPASARLPVLLLRCGRVGLGAGRRDVAEARPHAPNGYSTWPMYEAMGKSTSDVKSLGIIRRDCDSVTFGSADTSGTVEGGAEQGGPVQARSG